MVKLNAKTVAAGLVGVGLLLAIVALAAADGESCDVAMMLQAPIDAAGSSQRHRAPGEDFHQPGHGKR